MSTGTYARYSMFSSAGASAGVSSLNGLVGVVTISAGSGIALTPVGNNIAISTTGGGSGTVTSVSVVSANGFAGTVATATTTPAITLSTTITGILQGNGTAISAASTTGTGNVVLSASPTLTGTITATAANFSGAISASNFSGSSSGTNTGDVTLAAVGAVPNANGASLSGQVLNLQPANASFPGALLAADWTTFNNKQPAGSYITSLTGDATATGPGAAAITLATVNGNVGSFGSSTSIPSFTVNAKGLITAASGNVVIAPAGTLTGTTLASNVVTSSLTSLGVQSADLNMGSHFITNVTDPTTAQEAATKNYVDMAVAALQPLASVYAATTANIAGTYSNGVAGVGATFTTTSTATFTVDGTTPPLNSRILIKDQTSGFQNGVYTFTVAPVGGVSGAVFTRTLDYDTANDMNAAGLIPVINGTVNALSSWQQVAFITTVGTDSLVFTEFTANPSLYLLKANNLSDVASAVASFNNISPMTTAGDLIYENAVPSAARLGIGTSGQVLTVSGGLPVWANTAVSPGAIALTQNHILVGNASNVAADVAMSGDATIVASGALTLATVNGNVGSFGSSTSIPSFTVNAKGLITAASGNVVIAPAGTLTGTTLNATVVSSSLTSVGTVTSGTWNGSVIGPTYGGTGVSNPTAHQIPVAEGASNFTFISPSTAGFILTSNGTSADPSFQAPAAVSPGSITLTQNHILVGNGSNVAADVAMSGDATIVASGALTLATVNGNVGSFGSSTSISSFTVNAKGLITAASGNVVIAPAGTLSGTTLNSTVVSSSLTSVGTLTTGVWNASVIASTYVGLGRTINAQTGTTYTFVLADGSAAGGNPLVTASNASAQTYTVPTNASVAFPVGTQIDVMGQGAGKVTFAPAGGVTINSKAANLSISAQYVGVSLIKTATDTWTLLGDLIA